MIDRFIKNRWERSMAWSFRMSRFGDVMVDQQWPGLGWTSRIAVWILSIFRHNSLTAQFWTLCFIIGINFQTAVWTNVGGDQNETTPRLGRLPYVLVYSIHLLGMITGVFSHTCCDWTMHPLVCSWKSSHLCGDSVGVGLLRTHMNPLDHELHPH